jgi:protein-tyrosine phosphatase
MFDSILVVCTGNICRSPIGERYLQKMLPIKKLIAGVGALKDHAADESAVSIALKHNLSLEGHKGKQFTSSLARQYDLILAMEKSHIEQISRIAPEAEENNAIWSLDREKRYP